MTAQIFPVPLNVRMRRSPFWERSHAAGATTYSVYNGVLLASSFASLEEDYHHLLSAVQLWDVGCERQVEIAGPDAARLVQMTTPRDISRLKDDQCFYVPTVDGDGGMTNDPVLLKVGEDRYWLSIAPSDMILYCRALAASLKLDVVVREPDVWPLAIQGPKSHELVRRVWGDAASDIRFFRHKRVDVNGTPMVLARSGYSTQGGYELYFEGRSGGDLLWNQLMEAGCDLDIRAGCPNNSERIESGLLAYGMDITADMTPFEAGLGVFCEIERDVGCLGWTALQSKIAPSRGIRPIEIEGAPPPHLSVYWRVADENGRDVGRISASGRAFSFGVNAAIGLIDQSAWHGGTALIVHAPDGPRAGVVKEKFWRR